MEAKLILCRLLVLGLLWTCGLGIRPSDNCHTSPDLQCQHGGSCRNTDKREPNYYRCYCPQNYCGKKCHKKNPCYLKKLCQYMGRCVCKGQEEVYYTCYCHHPFTGKHCETLPDEFNPCYYRNICPNETICEPGVIRQRDKRPKSLVYHCKFVSNDSYYKVRQDPDPSMPTPGPKPPPKSACGRKRRCQNDEKCINSKCSKVLVSSTEAVTIVDHKPGKNNVTENSNTKICEIDDMFDKWAAELQSVFGQHPETTEDEDFDDIDTSGVDTQDIDSILFNQKRSQYIMKPSEPALNKLSAIREKIAKIQKRDAIQNSQFKNLNPCKHGARCILIGKENYKCLCPLGTAGKNCSEGCPQGTFNPPECKQRCGQCSAGTCDYKSGSCKGKCSPGWRGRFCRIRGSLTVFMEMKLSGPFDSEFLKSSSPQHKNMKRTVTNWITFTCIAQLKRPCSVYSTKLSEGSVNVENEVLFDLDPASNKDNDVSIDLVRTLKRNSDLFNSSMYKVVRESLTVTRVQRHASPVTRDQRHWWIILVICVAAGLIFFLSSAVAKLHAQSLLKCYFLQK